jgi:trehalose 6-phosphate phosphatase
MNTAKKLPCIFSQAGLSALKDFADRTTLFTFDLDGTLTPIIENPSNITIPGEIREKMTRLCSLANVAILTGRTCEDARSHLGFDPRFIVGNHGAEGIPGWEKREHEFADLCQGWEKQLRALLPPTYRSGIVIENKNSSLSIHYRKAPRRKAAHREILRAMHLLTPRHRQIAGKCVENILPQDSLNKGEALLRIMELAGAFRAVFVGDDDTDEDVFRMRNDHILGIRVGNGSSSEATFFLSDQNKIGRFLEEIINALTK